MLGGIMECLPPAAISRMGAYKAPTPTDGLKPSARVMAPTWSHSIWFDSPHALLSLEDMKRRPMVLAGLSVVLLAALAWMLRGTDSTETRNPRVTKSSTRSTDAALENPDESTRRERRASSPAARLDSSLTRHDASKLVNFILPKVEGKDVSIQRALALLKEAYQDACYLSREKALDLKFNVKDDPGYTISFSIKGKSFTACLNYLAALAGLEAKQTESMFELVNIADSEKPKELICEVFPGSQANLLEICGLQSADDDIDVESILRTAGVIRDTDSKFMVGPGNFWTFNGSTADRKRMTALVVLGAGSPNQLKFTTRTVTTAEPLDLKNSNLSPDESAALMRDLAPRAGTDVVTEPSVTARDGQSATIEIINEKDLNDWTGLRHELNGSLTGLKLVGPDKSEKRPETAEDTAWLSESQYALYPGDTQVQLVSSKNGKHIYRFLTVVAIDATGRPLDRDGNLVETPQEPQPEAPRNPPFANNNGYPTASQVPGKAGFVFSPFNNKVIDVGGVPSGTLVMDPTFPSAEQKMFRVP